MISRLNFQWSNEKKKRLDIDYNKKIVFPQFRSGNYFNNSPKPYLETIPISSVQLFFSALIVKKSDFREEYPKVKSFCKWPETDEQAIVLNWANEEVIQVSPKNVWMLNRIRTSTQLNQVIRSSAWRDLLSLYRCKIAQMRSVAFIT